MEPVNPIFPLTIVRNFGRDQPPALPLLSTAPLSSETHPPPPPPKKLAEPNFGVPMNHQQNVGVLLVGQQQNAVAVPVGQQNANAVPVGQQQNVDAVPLGQHQNASDVPVGQQQNAGDVPVGWQQITHHLRQSDEYSDTGSTRSVSGSVSESVSEPLSGSDSGLDSGPDKEIYIAQLNEAVFLREAPLNLALQVERRQEKFIEAAHIAASLGLHHILQPLLSQFPFLFFQEDDRGDTPLHVAARAGQLAVVNYLLTSRDNGRTNEEVERLRGLKNKKGNTALHEALENKQKEIATLLFQGHPELLNLPNNEEKTPPYLAAEAGLRDLFNDMLQSVNVGQDPIGWKGKTSLHAAIIIRDQESLASVLHLKPRLIEVTDTKGRNPIHYAASIGYHDGLSKLLEEHKQQAYQPDNEGIYPIHMAASNGHINVIKLLCQECPKSWSLLSKGGRNILHVAALSDKEDVVRYILNEQAMERLINNVDRSGNTPLHLASEGRNFKVVRVLTKDNRVNMSICNDKNLTAHDIAEENIANVASFRKILTLTALRIAKAPRARKPNIFDGKHLLRKGNDQQVGNDGKQAAADYYKERINTLFLASTLVATVTFAAGFTVPGGLNATNGTDLGIATMLTKTMFKVYVICDAIALLCSIIAVIFLIWAQVGDVPLMRSIIGLTWLLLAISLSMMAVAFTAGLYIVISPLHWLATVILIMTLIFLLCALALLLPLRMPIWSKNCFFQRISYYFMYLLVAVVGRRSDDDDGNGDIEARHLFNAPQVEVTRLRRGSH